MRTCSARRVTLTCHMRSPEPRTELDDEKARMSAHHSPTHLFSPRRAVPIYLGNTCTLGTAVDIFFMKDWALYIRETTILIQGLTTMFYDSISAANQNLPPAVRACVFLERKANAMGEDAFPET